MFVEVLGLQHWVTVGKMHTAICPQPLEERRAETESSELAWTYLC